jgi:glycosyltransferase involved in cell wall biosynthesis
MPIDPSLARTPLVSAIVPIYNHAKYIDGCLGSLAAQDYPRVEVIAIDDGSKDDSYETARAWFATNGARFERWVLLRQENAGITRTCNRLVAQCQGDLVFPLASDDEALPHAFSTLLGRHDPAAPKVLFSDVQIIDPDGALLAESCAQWRGRDLARLARSPWFLGWQILTSWGVPFQHQVFPRDLFHALGGYDESLRFEDAAFALRALAADAILFVPACTRRYRVRLDASPTPGIDQADWTMIPSRLAARRAFGPLMRLVLHVLNVRDRLPRRAMARRAISGGLDAISTMARLFGK